MLSCYVSLCSEFHIAHFFSFLCCPVTTMYVSLCSEFRVCLPQFFYGVRVVHFFSFFCVVLLCIFMFWVPCCNLRYDIRIKTMLCSSLPPAGGSRVHVLFTLFEGGFVWVFFVYPCLSFVLFSFHHCLSSTKHSLWLLLWCLWTFLGQKQEFWQLWRILLMTTNKQNYAISYKW